MNQSQQTQKTIFLTLSIIGIFFIYWTAGALHQNLINGKFQNSRTNQSQTFEYRDGLIIFPALLTWIAGQIINSRKQKRTYIPTKNSIICSTIIFISTFSYTIAAAKTSFPVVMAFKASNVLSVLLIAIFCTRVRDKSLNLPPKKLVIGFIITFGVFFFGFFDPQAKNRAINSEFIGIFLLLTSLLADGLLPDFQAQIKSIYKPQPTQMMTQINKWLAIISITYAVISFEIWQILAFMIYHPKFSFELIVMSLLSIIGQIIIYKLIKQFKQHIVPFVVTIRKIFTVLINIFIYGHQASSLQLLGILIVATAITYEFYSEIQQTEKPKIKYEENSFQENQSFGEQDNFLKNDQQKQ